MYSRRQPQMKAQGQLQGRDKRSLSIRQESDAHQHQNGRLEGGAEMKNFYTAVRQLFLRRTEGKV